MLASRTCTQDTLGHRKSEGSVCMSFGSLALFVMSEELLSRSSCSHNSDYERAFQGQSFNIGQRSDVRLLSD